MSGLGRPEAAADALSPVQRTYESTSDKDRLLPEITRRIVEAIHPRKIVLFGSYATGKQKRDSDLDLLVIMDTEEPKAVRTRRVYEVARTDPFLPMDILVYTPQELARRQELGDFFFREILSQGKVLYSRDSD